MKLKLLNNTTTIDSEFSDFEKEKFTRINLKDEFHSKILINRSKFSSTYKFKSHNKWLCLKQLNTDYSNNTLYAQAFENEFNIGYELDHSNIIQYYNFGKNLDGTYLIKEYIDGIDLHEYFSNISSYTIFYHELERIFTQLFDALNYLHTKQIYHLDLKPSNILITTKGNNVKLIDFGFSTRDNYSYNPSGTKKYLSPEQITNPIIVDGRSDIYSIGKILEELLTLVNKKRNVLHLFSYFKSLKIIQKCTHENQSKRFRSISELELSLRQNRNHKIYFAFIFLILLFITTIFIDNKPINSSIKKESGLPLKLEMNSKNRIQKNEIINKRKQVIETFKYIFKNKSINEKQILNTDTSKNINLELNEFPSYHFAQPTLSDLTTEDKLFCEKLIDSLHTNFEVQLSNKPKYIDIKALLIKYKIQLNLFGNKQLTSYNFKFCSNSNEKIVSLRKYYKLLLKEELEKIRKLENTNND